MFIFVKFTALMMLICVDDRSIDRMLLVKLSVKTMFKLNLYIISLDILSVEFLVLLRLNYMEKRLLSHSEAFFIVFR